MIDLRDPDRPGEVGHFDRGPRGPGQLTTAGSWPAYYNGYVYPAGVRRPAPDGRPCPGAEEAVMDEFDPQPRPAPKWG